MMVRVTSSVVAGFVKLPDMLTVGFPFAMLKEVEAKYNAPSSGSYFVVE